MIDSASSPALSPILYLPHGGGPLPILGDEHHEKMVAFLKEIAARLGEPSAILVISAHWEEECATLTGGSHPALIYDYYGFPPEAYQIQYDAQGDPGLAQTLRRIITAHGLSAKFDEQRGFDHGLFIPLKLMFPKAQIPCVQLSLLKNLDPKMHIALGKAIAPVRTQKVLIVGSGMSFHNMKAFFSSSADGKTANAAFNNWLIETCTGPGLSSEEREQRLIAWEKAPSARYCHPREEHLLPLHVCFGAASAETPQATTVFDDEIMGTKVASFLW